MKEFTIHNSVLKAFGPVLSIRPEQGRWGVEGIVPKVLFTFCFLLFTFYFSKAQQIPLYSQYYFNPFVCNPAMTGADDQANIF